MKKKFAKKLSTYSICIILPMLTLVGCANSDTSSTITKSNLHVTEKETLSTETKKSDSTPESTPKVESNSTNENQVNTSNTSDSESNEYSEPMNKEQSTSYVEQETYVSQSSQTQASIPAPTPVPPAPEPVTTPEPTPVVPCIPGWDETIVDSAAWTEKVLVTEGYDITYCNTCHQAFTGPTQVDDCGIHLAFTDCAGYHTEYTLPVYQTVEHPAVTHVVHHESSGC